MFRCVILVLCFLFLWGRTNATRIHGDDSDYPETGALQEEEGDEEINSEDVITSDIVPTDRATHHGEAIGTPTRNRPRFRKWKRKMKTQLKRNLNLTCDHFNSRVELAVAGHLGYELVDGWMGHYKVHSDKKNWFDASDVCIEEGAHLLIINSQQEADGVSDLIKKRTKAQLHWIGFHVDYEDGGYITVTNESLQTTGFMKWGIREPDEREGENCGVFGNYYSGSTSSYGLGDFWCSVLLPFVCEEETATVSTKRTHSLESKPSNGYSLEGSLGYYKLHAEPKSWFEAREVCESEGSHLLIINSDHEERISIHLARSAKKYQYWVGVHDMYKEGDFVTIFNESLQSTGYDKLHAQYPYGGTAMNCLQMINVPRDGVLVGGNKWGLDVAVCSKKHSFICEQEV